MRGVCPGVPDREEKHGSKLKKFPKLGSTGKPFPRRFVKSDLKQADARKFVPAGFLLHRDDIAWRWQAVWRMPDGSRATASYAFLKHGGVEEACYLAIMWCWDIFLSMNGCDWADIPIDGLNRDERKSSV